MPASRSGIADIPTILFGAFDRHNFGDLLLPHAIRSLIGQANPFYGGLAERNLRMHGGHRVHTLARLAATVGDSAVDIIHVGGETLTCSLWEAAVMLQRPEQARAAVALLDARPHERTAWAQAQLGVRDLAPYLLPAGMFANVRRVIVHAVGGIELGSVEPAMRAEVVAKLGAATSVGVRDQQTRAMLAENGIACRLEPDPAVLVAELFGDRIRRRARQGECARIVSGFPGGYLAVQFSADFGDDETLSQLAAQLGRIAQARNLGVVLFRAGAAPWHDDLACYQRLAARLRGTTAVLFDSLNLWDICALIAHSQGFVGSSLHGGIVAGAFFLPWLGLLRAAQHPGTSKQVAFAATWGATGAPAAVTVQDLAAGLDEAMAPQAAQRRELAWEWAKACRSAFQLVHRHAW
ncbi:polysaccharide pyruvyl transferase family protein [Cupriavidus lacunae]|uniref:Polysaccharide pyruvyl transferase family protein n=1 Tax=Cupriavidus lacunae TaxID=2666307 RepID=A0A370NRK6_9BURK|nr:polysaccharide pyruvyl transferase family protein [Cupriavidus lacunae]RDK08158.1 polysaccharide pyruvyl transferase family protein [Cupriavidus lacunae]